MSPRMEDPPEDLLKQEGKQSLIREVLDLRACLGDYDHVLAALGMQDTTDSAVERVLELLATESRALASDTARASAEAALRPFADFAARIAAERPGWDHGAFELFRASSPDVDQDWLLLTMAPFRRASATLENRT